MDSEGSRCSPSHGAAAGGGSRALAAALRRRCAVEGAQPWLFFREGWGWRWWSWQRAHDRLELELRAGGAVVEPGGAAEAESLVRELAVQLREWSPALLADLWQAAALLEQRLSETYATPRRWLGGPRSQRVAVDSAEVGTRGCHIARAWSIAVGAALVLPAGAEDWGDSVLWSRPTELWTGGAQLEWLKRQLEQRRARPRGLRRLRTVADRGSLDGRSVRLAIETLARRSVAVASFPLPASTGSDQVPQAQERLPEEGGR